MKPRAVVIQARPSDRFRLAEHAAIVVLLLEPVLAVLRRLAQEDETRRRGVWARTDEATAPRPGVATDEATAPRSGGATD